MESSENKFTWVQTHKELVEYLTRKEIEQKELIELLKDSGVEKGLVDEYPEGNRIELEEIDPFSFFCFIYKFGPRKRLEILQKIAKRLGLHYPEDEKGIPSAQAQKVMMFLFKHERSNEIELLWEFFFSALKDSITDKQFQDILKLYGVGIIKITEVLFYINPDKYLPINGPSKPYLKEVFGIDPNFKTWAEYLDILEQVKNVTDKPFYQISYEAWVWSEKQKETGYWLFQANPNVFDVKGALENDALTSWRVNAHKEKIKTGDKVILWVSGENRGCYALAEVESDVYEDRASEDELPYYSEQTGDDAFDQVELKITHNLAENPITKDQIKYDPRLTHLNIGNQGTNFTATKSEYEAIVEMVEVKNADPKWERLQKTVQKINHEEAVRKFFTAVQQTLSELNLVEESPNFYAAAVDYYLHVTVGGKYLLYIEIKDDDIKLAFHIGKNQLKTLKEKYPDLEVHEGTKDTTLDSVFVKLNPRQVEVDDFIQPLVEVGRRLDDKYSKSSYRATYPDAYNPWIFRVAYSEDLLDKLLQGKKMGRKRNQKPEIYYPLNTIFYGPPGTGKTYTTIHRASEIVEGRKIENHAEAKEIFSNRLGETIEFITFHQNYSYEDFIQGLRPDIENSQQLTFERTDGVFKKLADKALKNWKASEKPQTKKLSFKQVFNEFIQPLIEGEVEEIEVEMKRVSFYITAVTDKSIEFRKTTGNTAHTLSISTLKKMYEAESVMEIQGLSSYYSPLLKELLDRGKSPGETEVTERKNYVMIIDEINRANISRVFGELITLIEPDKRYGREHHIPAKLPSGESFSVPENLYIIGTMNTADKSIALLDIALRRRFEFEAMYPEYEINGHEIHDADILKKINERIIKLKGHDFQIGHSYFMKNHLTLQQRMNRKVIPLLLEYFMNDEKEVKDILTHAGLKIKENSWPLKITGKA